VGRLSSDLRPTSKASQSAARHPNIVPIGGGCDLASHPAEHGQITTSCSPLIAGREGERERGLKVFDFGLEWSLVVEFDFGK